MVGKSLGIGMPPADNERYDEDHDHIKCDSSYHCFLFFWGLVIRCHQTIPVLNQAFTALFIVMILAHPSGSMAKKRGRWAWRIVPSLSCCPPCSVSPSNRYRCGWPKWAVRIDPASYSHHSFSRLYLDLWEDWRLWHCSQYWQSCRPTAAFPSPVHLAPSNNRAYWWTSLCSRSWPIQEHSAEYKCTGSNFFVVDTLGTEALNILHRHLVEFFDGGHAHRIKFYFALLLGYRVQTSIVLVFDELFEKPYSLTRLPNYGGRWRCAMRHVGVLKWLPIASPATRNEALP